MSLYGDKLIQSIGSGVDQVTIAVGSGQDNLAKGSSTPVDNLDYPLTRTSANGTVSSSISNISVVSTAGFPTAGSAFIKVGQAIVKVNYTDKTANTLIDAVTDDSQSYVYASGCELFLNKPNTL